MRRGQACILGHSRRCSCVERRTVKCALVMPPQPGRNTRRSHRTRTLPGKARDASAMIQLEQRLQQRFPQWFRGRRAVIARPLVRGLGRWSRLDAIDAFLAANRQPAWLRLRRGGAAVPRRALPARPGGACADSGARAACWWSPTIPAVRSTRWPCWTLVGKVRRDVRIVANDFLLGARTTSTSCCCRCASWAAGRARTACARSMRRWQGASA